VNVTELVIRAQSIQLPSLAKFNFGSQLVSFNSSPEAPPIQVTVRGSANEAEAAIAKIAAAKKTLFMVNSFL
jgi:hypothetical protein